MRNHQHLSREQTSIALAVSDKVLTGSHDRRWAVILGLSGPQSLNGVPTNVQNQNTSTATTGIKCTFQVPVGCNGTLKSASFFETTGTLVVAALQINPAGAGGIATIAQYTTSGAWIGDIPLQSQDIISWNVTTAIASSVSDFRLNMISAAENYRATVSFKGVAVIDQGFTLYPGQDPQI